MPDRIHRFRSPGARFQAIFDRVDRPKTCRCCACQSGEQRKHLYVALLCSNRPQDHSISGVTCCLASQKVDSIQVTQAATHLHRGQCLDLKLRFTLHVQQLSMGWPFTQVGPEPPPPADCWLLPVASRGVCSDAACADASWLLLLLAAVMRVLVVLSRAELPLLLAAAGCCVCVLLGLAAARCRAYRPSSAESAHVQHGSSKTLGRQGRHGA